MRSHQLIRALAVMHRAPNLELVRQLPGMVRAMGLTRTLEFLQTRRASTDATDDGTATLAEAFAGQLGLGSAVEAAVERLERLPRAERLQLERESRMLADAIHLACRSGLAPEAYPPPSPLNATDATRTPLTQMSIGAIRHVGLAASRLLPVVEGGAERADALRLLVEGAHASDDYRRAYLRWRRFTSPTVERRAARVKATGWLLCGLGNPSPTENGLALHPTWGVPWIPGTSLKGIAKAWLREAGASQKELDDWFGRAPKTDPDPKKRDAGQAGAVDFLDAWWDPRSQESPWVTDIVTPHNKRYYESSSNTARQDPPSGEEDPIPNVFLAARGTFRIVVEAQQDWVEPALDLLLRALAERGVGAKTRAGYGRMEQMPADPADTEALQVSGIDPALGAARQEKRARIARRSSMEPGVRIDDVQAHEGLSALQTWVFRGGEPALDGVPAEEPYVRAAVRALFAGRQAASLHAAEEPFTTWVTSELSAIAEEVRLATQPDLNMEKFTALIEKHTNQNGRIDFNKVARAVAAWGLSEEDVERVAAILDDKGARPGHLRVLREG